MQLGHKYIWILFITLNGLWAFAQTNIDLLNQEPKFTINTADILYCKADNNYTEIYLNNNKKKLVSKTLKYFEDALSDGSFARVHKFYLVNVNEVVKYVKGKGGSLVLSNGKQIIVSVSKKSQLLSYFK